VGVAHLDAEGYAFVAIITFSHLKNLQNNTKGNYSAGTRKTGFFTLSETFSGAIVLWLTASSRKDASKSQFPGHLPNRNYKRIGLRRIVRKPRHNVLTHRGGKCKSYLQN
jgi:hypothetical protein